MADRIAPKFAVCPSAELADGQHRKLTLTFEGREEECLLLRFDDPRSGEVLLDGIDVRDLDWDSLRGSMGYVAQDAYINLCVHMPRRLDGEEPKVFDPTGRYLRCSMHGIVYTPQTGASISTMCEGERLRAVDSYEDGGEVGIADFRMSTILAPVK